MKRIKVLLAILVTVFVGLGWTITAHAQTNFRTGNDVTVPAGQTIDSSLFISGRTVDIAGTVDGDIFCAGQDVSVTGTVTGDVICAGQTVHVGGHVNGSIRVVGQTVTIDSVVDKNLTAAGQDVSLSASSVVGGDATVGGQNATLDGTIGRDLAISATSVIINGAVNRNVRAVDTDLTLGNSSRIGGNLSYGSRHDVSRLSGAQVVGTISRSEPAPGGEQGMLFGQFAGGNFLFALYSLIALLVVALVLILLIPQFIHEATDVAIRSPWKTLLVGFLASIVVPIVIVVLLFTLVGIPLAILLLLSWTVIVCVAVPFAAYWLGSLLLSKSTTNPVWIMLLGAAIILVLYLIPVLGFIVWLVATWFGLGILLLQYTRLPRPHYDIQAAKR